MKRFLSVILIFSLAGLYSCKDEGDDTSVVVTGYVYYLDENSVAQVVEGALVYSTTFYAQTKTDAQGQYQFSLEPTEDEINIVLQASKVGFEEATTSVLAQKGQTVSVPDITLEKLSTDSLVSPTDTLTTSGEAAHIVLGAENPTHVYISGSGLDETALFQFLVTDAKGVPVDASHKVTVNFSIMNGPEGGEYIYPESMETQDGWVYTILNTGTLAGAVQIEATAEINGKTIRTQPIRTAIYGGLPDADHFSVALERANIAGWVHYGILNNVTAFVGDKFSNPVAPGTIVYFETDYGIVEGASVTDEMGRATVRFMSAQPLPPNPAVESLAEISVTTFNDIVDSEKITTSTKLLLSGRTNAIQVSPSSFTYTDFNRPVNFNYVVSDVWGYPIVGGSHISVSSTAGTLYGDVDVNLLDTQASGPGTTDFSFTWAPGDSLEAPAVQINVVVETPEDGNGYRSTSVSGAKTN